MVIMAGMLPGVECARRRRMRQGGGSAEAPCGTRRPSLCLYAHHLGSSGSSSKEWSGACKEKEMARARTLDSNAREAKERLDQKLRSQRESVLTRHQGAGPPSPAKTRAASSGNGNCNDERESEVLSSKGGRRRFSWVRLGRRSKQAAEAVAEAEASEECAVCLEELRAGEVLLHLPCAHRFHWACAVPWVRAAARCPVCRAQVRLGLGLNSTPAPTPTPTPTHHR